MWASYSQQTDTAAASPELAAAQRLWFSLLGFVVALAASVVLNLLVGLFHAPAGHSMPMASLVGSTVMGAALLAPASVLIRKANYDSQRIVCQLGSVRGTAVVGGVAASLWGHDSAVGVVGDWRGDDSDGERLGTTQDGSLARTLRRLHYVNGWSEKR